MYKNSQQNLSDENLNLFKKVVELTYGNQEEIKKRGEGSDKFRLISVLIIKPVEELNEHIIEFYLSELKSLGITNSTWDEKLWAFRALIPGNFIPKLKEKGFMVLLDRKIKIISEY